MTGTDLDLFQQDPHHQSGRLMRQISSEMDEIFSGPFKHDLHVFATTSWFDLAIRQLYWLLLVHELFHDFLMVGIESNDPHCA